MLTFFSLSSGSEPAVLTMSKNLPEQKAAGEAVSRISFKDPLTGVYTREFFEEEANRLDSDRQLPISIIIGDVNGLGLINAALGNAAGDALLKTTAKLLKRTCRSSDLLARWGGDEFIILLPHTREHDAASIAARIEDIFRENRLKDLPAAPGMTVGYFAKLHRWQDLGNIIKDAEEDMNRKKAAESRKAREDILEGILEFLSQNTPETAEHVASVQKTARFLGRKIGLEEESLEMLERAARFHDLGKAAIQPRILLKTSPLSEEEWEEVRKHAETGFRAAEAAGVFSAAAAGAILSHHERWDGTGYPSGLSGESIPLLSRIICLADSFDIMTRGTPYKPPLTRAEALGEIRAMAGKQFDPVLASILVSEMETSGTDQEK
jgi:diguanylate cyclase (GGDEF)-like protein